MPTARRIGQRAFLASVRVFVLVLFLRTLAAHSIELSISDYDNQSVFNNFSGDSGAFANGEASLVGGFDTNAVRNGAGASLRLRYSVPSGFCGVWNSLLGKGAFPRYALNLTNLHGPLRNSAGNPSRIEGVRATTVYFWARGNGDGAFEHQLKTELKSATNVVASAIFAIPNDTTWRRYVLPLTQISAQSDVSAVKELILVVEDWRNQFRQNGTLYIDDLTLTTDERDTQPARWGDDALLDVVSHRAFSYFMRFTDGLGFALDRSTFSDMVSAGTIGFQLTAYCIGHHRGWADRKELEERVASVLRNLAALPMGPEPGSVNAGYRGFYYHFLAADRGTRKDNNVELSLYDTMLVMYGILACREYFPDHPEIQKHCRELFDRVEWDWFVDRRPGPNQHRFHLEWHPDGTSRGRFRHHVDGQTDEALMVDLLALGSRTHPVTLETYLARNRYVGRYPSNAAPILVSWQGSMFNYFFAACWMNFEARGLDIHPTLPIDLWRNNRLAILANRQFCIDHSSGFETARGNRTYATYGENAWGLTACDNLPGPNVNAPGQYIAFGALPGEENIRFKTRALHAGTIAVYGAASAINFTPKESLAALRHYFTIPKLWNPLFGFGDAFSLDPHWLQDPYDAEGNPTIRPATHLNGPWINAMTMGVNVGPMLLAIENHRSGFVWKLTENIPELTTGLDLIFGIATREAKEISIVPEGVRLKWDRESRASAYAIYTSTNLSDWKLLQSGIQTTEWTIPGEGTALAQRFYLIKALR